MRKGGGLQGREDDRREDNSMWFLDLFVCFVFKQKLK